MLITVSTSVNNEMWVKLSLRTEIKNVQDCLFTHTARDAAMSLTVVQHRQVVIALEAQRFQGLL